MDVSLPLVTFRWTLVFPDGEVVKSHSTLRFRARDEVQSTLVAHGYVVDDVRDGSRPARSRVRVLRSSFARQQAPPRP
jgi:hypothetical protein